MIIVGKYLKTVKLAENNTIDEMFYEKGTEFYLNNEQLVDFNKRNVKFKGINY